MGGGISTIPMQIDKETFRKISGGSFNDEIFDANSVAGIMTREKLIELSSVTDCYLSYESGKDSYGRPIDDRVARINQYLRSKGLMTFFDDNKTKDPNLMTRVCKGVDSSKVVVCFITKGYIAKVTGKDLTDKNLIEFTYTLRRKHPNFMIPVILEEDIMNAQQWGGTVGLALSDSAGGFVEFGNDENFEVKCNNLYQRIITISRKNLIISPSLLVSSSLLHELNKPKQEQQFFQWMSRSTNIDERKRLIYCASLVKLGVSSVFQLANLMKNVPNFLTSIGMNEPDADQIALAVRDLGLGYVPVRDFETSQTVESVMFALNKSSTCSDDPAIAASALACVARVAASHRIMPTILLQSGVCDAVVKLIKRHVAHGQVLHHGSISIHIMSSENPEVCEKYGVLTACECIPRLMKSHTGEAEVIISGCTAIATLGQIHENRMRFSPTVACEVVVAGLNKHVNHAEVAEKACMASISLATGHLENAGKLVIAGACAASIQALVKHMASAAVVQHALHLIAIISGDINSRAKYGAETPCCAAIVNALQSHGNSSEVVFYGCNALVTVATGNAFNRGLFGKAGACEEVKALMLKYQANVTVAPMICRAIFILVSGSNEHKAKLNGVQQSIQQIINSKDFSDAAKKDAKDALRVVQ